MKCIAAIFLLTVDCTSVPVFTLSGQKEKTLGMRLIEPIKEAKKPDY